ncbi:MAG: peptide deformylase [Frankiales bacterium]|nr:peptide deformylase [Frankiales bacterium]MCW2706957.1 peptide deformylase [Frankiales bacterium]
MPDPLSEGGTARPITMHGEPVLHARCSEVTVFDDELVTLVKDMYQSMYAANGVGLAANQIGVGLRVFVVDCPDDEDERVVAHVVNPTLELPQERELDDSAEGCLSVPGPSSPVARPNRARVRGVDVHGEPVVIEGTGTLARCLQHESDHLDGMVYVDRLSTKERKRVLAEAFPAA